MLWSIFKFIFNVARTLSLIIVLGLIAFFGFILLNEEALDEFKTLLAKEKREESREIKDRELIERAFEENDEEEEFGMMGAMELPQGEAAKRIKIPTKKGTAYLRPNHIMYIKKNIEGILEITTISDYKMECKAGVRELESLLMRASENSFFATKSDIINYNYVLEVKMDGYYKMNAIMENNDFISLSLEKGKELKELLEDLSY